MCSMLLPTPVLVALVPAGHRDVSALELHATVIRQTLRGAHSTNRIAASATILLSGALPLSFRIRNSYAASVLLR